MTIPCGKKWLRIFSTYRVGLEDQMRVRNRVTVIPSCLATHMMNGICALPRGNYSATSNKVSWYTGRWWVGCYIWYSEEGPGRAGAPHSSLLAVPNVTAHPSTASVPITVLLYNGPLLCGFNAGIKGLIGTLKPQSNGPLYIWWLVHWPLMGGLLHLVQRARRA